MEPKDSNTGSSRGAGSIYGSSSGMAAMKRSNLELDLVEFVRMAMIASPDPSSDDSLKTDGGDPSSFLPPDSAVTDLGSASTTWEMNCFDETSSGELGVPPWCQTLMMKHSSIQATSPTPTGSQSSVCVGNAMSSNKPTVRDGQGRGATTRFAHEQLDDDDGEIETDSCEQSAEPNDKRIRRKISNRESAKRSRKRKQEHLAGMEIQVDCLMAEKATLSKQLTGAVQQYQVANTDNLVLKSNVEALRIKVQLAEAMVARGSIDSSLVNLLQSPNSQPSINSLNSIGYIANVPPSVIIPGDNDSSFTAGSTVTRQNSCIGAENGDSGNSSIANGIMGEALSCALQIWQ